MMDLTVCPERRMFFSFKVNFAQNFADNWVKVAAEPLGLASDRHLAQRFDARVQRRMGAEKAGQHLARA